jgi:hypothetical protein
MKRGAYKFSGVEGATALEDFIIGGAEVLAQLKDGDLDLGALDPATDDDTDDESINDPAKLGEGSP